MSLPHSRKLSRQFLVLRGLRGYTFESLERETVGTKRSQPTMLAKRRSFSRTSAIRSSNSFRFLASASCALAKSRLTRSTSSSSAILSEETSAPCASRPVRARCKSATSRSRSDAIPCKRRTSFRT